MSKKARVNGTHSKPGHNSGRVRIYRTVNEVAVDPAIEMIAKLMSQERLDAKKISVLSNVGESTIKNWLAGETRRPQHITLSAALGAMGHEFVPKRIEKKDYDKEFVSAASWHKRHDTAHAPRSKK